MRAALARLDPDRLVPWLCIAAAGAWFGAIAWRFPAGDGDLLWQRWLGDRILREHAIPRSLGTETFAASGAPWTPHEWLFSLLLAWSDGRGATWAVPLLCAVALVAALSFVALRCARRGVAPVRTASAVLLCSLAMMQSFGVRAQVLGWAGVTALLWLLESEGPLAWAAVPVTVVWANLHASALLAPVVAATFALTAFARERRVTRAVRRSAAIAAACGAATLATPLGLDLPRYAVALSLSPIRQSISEWGPSGAGSAAFVLGALPLLLVLLAFGARAPVRDRVLLCGFAVLLFSAVRNVPVFALIAAPIAVAALPRRPVVAGPSGAPRAAAWALAAVLACMTPALALLVWRAAPERTALLPFAPARTLLRVAAAPPRVFCEDFAWCSIFLAEARPARFFMDGRCDPYPPPLWREYRDVMDGSRRWSAVLDARRIDAVLVRRNGTLDSLLAERPALWRVVAADERARVYVRPALLRGGARRPAPPALAAR